MSDGGVLIKYFMTHRKTSIFAKLRFKLYSQPSTPQQSSRVVTSIVPLEDSAVSSEPRISRRSPGAPDEILHGIL